MLTLQLAYSINTFQLDGGDEGGMNRVGSGASLPGVPGDMMTEMASRLRERRIKAEGGQIAVSFNNSAII